MQVNDLIDIAKNAKKNAYANITKYKVGAALLAESGTVYIGVNVEEPSILGLSNCAERVAIQNAIAHGERKFKAIAVVGSNYDDKCDSTLVPCGTCLQYILDMCDNVDIICYMGGKITSKKVKDLLNSPFELEKQN